MEQTLLLNASYEPLKIVHWQKAVTLWCQGKVEIISVYDREVRAVTFSFKLPSVIRLLRYVRMRRRFDYVPFSRANIYARDEYHVPVLRRHAAGRRADLRPRHPGRPRRPQGLGEHRHLLRHLQPRQGGTHAGAGGHAAHPPGAAAVGRTGLAHHDRRQTHARELARLLVLAHRARRVVNPAHDPVDGLCPSSPAITP